VKRVRPRDPHTPEEWQEAVNQAQFLLGLDACRQYGLIEGGPGVKHERARRILERGLAKGFAPASWDKLIELYLVREPLG
jgi:hypothetical protein